MNFSDGKPVSAKFSGMKKGNMVAWINALSNNEVDRDNLPSRGQGPYCIIGPGCMINQPLKSEHATNQKEDKQTSRLNQKACGDWIRKSSMASEFPCKVYRKRLC